MARKKSAAKKAREAEEKLKEQVKQSQVSAEQDTSKAQTASVSESESESESSEEEDEYGELVTEKVDEGINKLLNTIRSDPSKLLDKDFKVFEEEEQVKSSKKEKPMYLKDYHRLNILLGGYKEEDNEYGTVDGEKPFVVEQREERDQLLSDIKNAFNDEDEESEDDFLKKKEKTAVDEEPVALPDPKNEDEFLQTFLDNKAWIPRKNDKIINLDRAGEDDDEFDNAVEKFESAYNFRYEDPTSAEIVSYARNQATLRRDKSNSRKRQRELEKTEKEQKLQEREEKIKKKETSKLNKAMDNLKKIKDAVGGEVSDETIQRVFGDSLLNDDFDDADWDSKMSQIFDEQFYNEDEQDDVVKPEWSDVESQDEPEEEPPSKKSKKDKLKEKKEKKKEKESIKEKAKKLVDANKAKIIDEVQEEERGRSKEDDVKFKYREVSPESFGLTARDIFIADDKQLNLYIGIKKFAPYRPEEARVKDRRKYKKKKKALEEWRKDVFKGYEQKDDDKNSIWIPVEEQKKSKKSKKH